MTVEGSFSKIVSKTLLGKLPLCERETIFLLVNPLHTHTHKYIFIPGSFVINVYDVSWKTFPTWKETIIALSLSVSTLCWHSRGGRGIIATNSSKGKGFGRRREEEEEEEASVQGSFRSLCNFNGPRLSFSLSLSLSPLPSAPTFSSPRGRVRGRDETRSM